MQHLYKVILSMSLLICSTMPVLAQSINHPQHPQHPDHPPKPPKPHQPPSSCITHVVSLSDPINAVEGMEFLFSLNITPIDLGTDTLWAYFTLTGTATRDKDYTWYSGPVPFYTRPGSNDGVWPMTCIGYGDEDVEGDETLTFTLDSVISTCGQSRMEIGNNSVTVTMFDDDWNPADYPVSSPIITNGAEGGPDATISMSMEGDKLAPEDIIGIFEFSDTEPYSPGIATPYEDYVFTTSVIIPMGQHTGTTIISIVDDSIPEPTESAHFRLLYIYGMNDRDSYPYTGGEHFTMTITDNDSLQAARVAATNAPTGKQVISMYPNPVTTDLYVTMNKPAPGARLVISTPAGKALVRKNITSSKETISLATLPPGIYFVTIINGEKITTHKIVKQ